VVNRRAPCLSILLLTEDSGSDAFDTFQRLVKELLKQVDEYVQTQPDKITFEPVRNKEALQALHANMWKSTQPRDRNKQVELVRTLATQLLLENGWAFFHFDGDRAWKDRDSSENAAKFKEFVWKKVRLLIRSTLEEREKKEGRKPDIAALETRATRQMERLKQAVPYYSIEAWLFQNTSEAIRLCETHYSSRDVEQFLEWEQDRPALDEVVKPKESVCLGAKHNLALASQGFPAREARGAGKSFAAVVQALSQDAELCEVLRRTYFNE
jgi:septum formation topological specificity factor MinE